MTVKEIHILINNYLQEINSNVYGNVKAEEIDFIFNLEVLQYIRNIMNPKTNRVVEGFEHTKNRYDALKQLKRTINLPVYKSTGNFVYTLLPPDYYRFDNSASKIVTFCNNPITDTDTTINKYVVYFRLTDIVDSILEHGVDRDFFKGFNFKIDETDSLGGPAGFEFDLNDYYSDGFPDESLRYVILHLLFEEINKNNKYKCYWNFYNKGFYDDTLIIESDTDFVVTTFYDEISSIAENVTTTIDAELVTHTAYTYIYTGEYYLKPNRLVGDEDFEVLSNSMFAKSIATSPLSKLEQDWLMIELPTKSMISNIQLKYIKKPNLINLYLNRNTDIGTDVLDIIAKKTAETISRLKSNNNNQLIEHSNVYND